MVWELAALGGAQIFGGIMGSRSSSRAARQQRRAAEAGIVEQREARESFEQRTEPFRQVGLAAAPELLSLLGIDVSQFQTQEQQFDNRADVALLEGRIAQLNSMIGDTPQSERDPRGVSRIRPNPEVEARRQDLIAQRDETQSQLDSIISRQQVSSDIAGQTVDQIPGSQTASQQAGGPDQLLAQANPLVSFLRDEGFEDIQESAAARGTLRSGGTLEDLTRFNTNVAATVVPQLQQQRFNQLFNLLGLGSNAAVGQGQAALSTATNIGGLLGNAGAASGGGIMGQNAALQSTIGGLSGLVGAQQAGLFDSDPFGTKEAGYSFSGDPFSTSQRQPVQTFMGDF